MEEQFKTLHCKRERSVLALQMGPFRCLKYSPIFESNLSIKCNYLGLICSQALKWALALAGLAF